MSAKKINYRVLVADFNSYHFISVPTKFPVMLITGELLFFLLLKEMRANQDTSKCKFELAES